jgi:guanyl-specific ribonuclease Sa
MADFDGHGWLGDLLTKVKNGFVNNCWCSNADTEAFKKKNLAELNALQNSPAARAVVTTNISFALQGLQQTVQSSANQAVEAAQGGSNETTPAIPSANPAVPANVLTMLSYISATGDAVFGGQGGGDFRNDGRGGGQVLPQTTPQGSPIQYREWDVNPAPTGKRDAERVITGTDGSAYYTSDHYTSLIKIK